MIFTKKVRRLFGLPAAVACVLFLQQNIVNADYPCDIYEDAGTPCVAAYSMVRVLSGSYDGPLYQVRRADGQTKDIPQDEDGFADASVQDEFLGNSRGTVSKLYDQSGKGNDLTAGKKGCYEGTASQNNNETDAKGRKVLVGGHNVYALQMNAVEGYRSNQEGYSGYPDRVEPANGMPQDNEDQGIYMVCDGKRYGDKCCWNFGNGSTNNCYGPTGQMNTLFFGTAYWGRGAGNGPWFMNDMEAGVWAGGSKPGEPGWGALDDGHPPNPDNPSINWDFAFGISKASTENRQPKYCLRMANAQQGDIQTAWDGNAPTTWKMEGGIILGIGGDNSNSSYGTFFEGCITAGRPSDETDAAILQNVQNIGYGSSTVSTLPGRKHDKAISSSTRFGIHYNSSNSAAIISYSVKEARHVRMDIFNQLGRHISTIDKGVVPAGRRYEHVWSTERKAPGVYFVRINLDDNNSYTDKIIVRK